jgi:hypothetical protein
MKPNETRLPLQKKAGESRVREKLETLMGVDCKFWQRGGESTDRVVVDG